jgi:hypothetical protein
MRNDIIPIELSDYSVKGMLGDNFKDKLLLTCYSDNEITFDKDAKITAMYEQYMVNDDFISSTAYDFNTVYHPIGVNKENRSFSIMFDKYFDLSVSKTEVSIDENGDKWWYIWFNGSHLFDVSTGETYKLYITFDGPTGYNEDNPHELTVGVDECVTSSIIRFPYSKLQEIDNLENVIFYNEDNQTVNDVSRVRFFRDNFVFTTGMFRLYLDRPMATVTVPVFHKFSTDLYEDDGIRENFTDVETKKAINKIVEMEKDVYHPVIWASVNDENHGYVKDEVYKIRFNLHFREHRDDDWLADVDTYWNGVNSKNPANLRFINGYFTTDKVDKEEYQSDLLTYLNFTDKDVRYQKNKLKKSFLRVMFFDSMNPTNQNMLAYYTIFMDSGNYFSKYVRYIESEGYKRISKIPDDTGKYDIKDNLNGIKVDREPTKTSNRKDIDSDTDMDDVESVRLSSQLVVEDKYMSDASSEGFYLYLWKDNFLGTIPQNIYMKVEFNHAGYGRTIPFMCPFRDPNKNEGNGFKSFNDILMDWSVSEEDWGSDTDKRYGIKKYLKYSYIRFKYKYDKITKRHVYYLDDEFYGTNVNNGGVHFEDNAITINLYEAKIV